MNDISLRLCQLFCREGLNLGSRLHTIFEENKWKENTLHQQKADAATDPALACGDAVFTAAIEVAFGDTAVPEVASSSTAGKVRARAIAAVELAFEAASLGGKNILAQMGRAVEHDLTVLASLNLGVYPEFGRKIEPMEEGPLGALWPTGTPESLSDPIRLAESASSYILSKEADSAAVQRLPKSNSAEQLSSVATERPSNLCRYFRDTRLFEILQGGKLYCAKPSSFNDPFDGQLLSHHKFSRQELINAFREELTLFLQRGNKLPGRQEMEPFEGLVWFYQNVDTTFTQDGFVNFAVALLDSKEINLKPSYSERKLISGLVNIIRVLCLSEEHDNLLLWSHYTGDHKGGVVQLRLDAGSAYLPLSQAVEYSHELPPSGSSSEVARSLFGLFSDSSLRIRRQLFTKSIDWAYEKEWRILMGGFTDENGYAIIRPEDIEAIYLGCRMGLDIKRSILDLIEEKYKHVIVYQAKKDEMEFQLNFVPIRVPFCLRDETPSEKLGRMTELYNDCRNMYFQVWNDPYWVIEPFDMDILRLDCRLGQRAPSNIRRVFRLMLDEIKSTFSRTAPLPKKHDLTSEMLKTRQKKIMRPSALLYQEWWALADSDLRTLGGGLPDMKNNKIRDAKSMGSD